MKNRQVRALALLAGNGACLLFSANLFFSTTSNSHITALMLSTFSLAAVALSYAALVVSNDDTPYMLSPFYMFETFAYILFSGITIGYLGGGLGMLLTAAHH